MLKSKHHDIEPVRILLGFLAGFYWHPCGFYLFRLLRMKALLLPTSGYPADARVGSVNLEPFHNHS